MNREENDLLTRTDTGTAMGALFRRYWLPALTVEELPEPDCPPVRTPLLGERLVAFRDSDGRVGLLEEACPHRQASLYFGRNEASGIRCAYHGWKFDRQGRCLDIPSEPSASGFRDAIRVKSYPTVERGGVIWAYLGAPQQQPPPPEFEWATLPTSHLFVSKRLQECNYLQVMEGGLDSSHLSFLHRGTIGSDPVIGMGGSGTDSRILKIIAGDPNPRYETAETDGGLLLGARRIADHGLYYWRVTQFLMPCFNIIAPTGDLSLNAQAWVPLDDHNCWSWAVNYHVDKPLSEAEREAMRRGGGLHVEFVPGTHQGRANRSNDYQQDRAAQGRGDSFTGIPSFAMQDTAVQESQGRIADRTLENLVSSDNGIIVTRRLLARAARSSLAGGPVPGLEPASQAVRAASIFAAEDRLGQVPRDSMQPLPRHARAWGV
ncbi:Rieske 2Fe-2S domain-containing protein [Immundisolibacter sp.]|uniref:aromatic ring-hydroxylating dioxygenase subunit alpha n=1 Tax=Immundisolibacter sp. TaxID=1934948 RepID=UPI0035682757